MIPVHIYDPGEDTWHYLCDAKAHQLHDITTEMQRHGWCGEEVEVETGFGVLPDGSACFQITVGSP